MPAKASDWANKKLNGQKLGSREIGRAGGQKEKRKNRRYPGPASQPATCLTDMEKVGKKNIENERKEKP